MSEVSELTGSVFVIVGQIWRDESSKLKNVVPLVPVDHPVLRLLTTTHHTFTTHSTSHSLHTQRH